MYAGKLPEACSVRSACAHMAILSEPLCSAPLNSCDSAHGASECHQISPARVGSIGAGGAFSASGTGSGQAG